MEGKAILFKEFAGIDAFPICFENYQTDFTDQIRNIAPVFGGINLEDIAAPKCFEVTTGIFCRPSCPARKPLPRNVEFFPTPKEALFAGYERQRRA